MAYWRPGSSVARIRWVDGQNVEHGRVVTDDASAVDLLLAIGRDPTARVVACALT
jgi:hypothetical protein